LERYIISTKAVGPQYNKSSIPKEGVHPRVCEVFTPQITIHTPQAGSENYRSTQQRRRDEYSTQPPISKHHRGGPVRRVGRSQQTKANGAARTRNTKTACRKI